MKLFVAAKPNAKTDKVERVDDSHFKVWVKAKPDQGKANEAVRDALSDHLGVPKSRLSLVQGRQSRNKVFEFRA